jgi:hypothetical protein
LAVAQEDGRRNIPLSLLEPRNGDFECNGRSATVEPSGKDGYLGRARLAMGFISEFDAKNNIPRGTIEGPVTDGLPLDYYGAAARYTASHPPCSGLRDFSKVAAGHLEVSSDTIRQWVERPPIITAGYMRAVVAPQDFLFGMMRMLEILSQEARPELHVVRTMDEAYRLLLVESPEFTLVN